MKKSLFSFVASLPMAGGSKSGERNVVRPEEGSIRFHIACHS